MVSRVSLGGPTDFSEAPSELFCFHVGLHQLGDDFIAFLQFFFALKDFFVFFQLLQFLGRSRRLFIHLFERSFGLSQHYVDPLVNLAGLDIQFSSKVADRNLILEMPTDNFGF